eukprot:gene21269-28190_t
MHVPTCAQVAYMCNASHPSSNLAAVRRHKFLTIPFSSSVLGPRLGDAAVNLAIAALFESGLASPSLISLASSRFTNVDEVSQGYRQATADDGTGFFLSLPTNLRAVCPLSEPDEDFLVEPSPAEDKLSGGEIAAIVVCSVIGAVAVVALGLLAWKYKRLRHEYYGLKESMLPVELAKPV